MTQFQQEILSTVVKDIMDAEYKHFQRQIDDLVDKNRELLGPDTWDGFFFKNKWYAKEWMRGRPNQSLHPDLHPTMVRISSFMETVETDKRIITQVLGKLIVNCNDYQSVRDELPECVIAVSSYNWNYFHRTKEPAQSIQGDELAVRQYNKVLTKIEAYCAMRYLL